MIGVPRSPMSAIVTNARSRIAYNVARSLARRGVDVFAGDFVPKTMTAASRYVRDAFLYPSPFRDADGFIRVLAEEIERRRADVLMPVYEETFLVARHKDALSQIVKLAVPDYAQILVAHNKDQWERVAATLGIPVPRSCSRDDLANGAVPLRDLRFPVLIKPKQGGGAWGIEEAATPEALEARLAAPLWQGRAWDRFFVQEKIAGDTHCIGMLFRRGQVRAKVAYRQLRDFPVTGGQATLRVSLRSERAEALLQQLLEHLDWHGPCQADFIVERATGVPYLIDVNPRLWGSLVQAIASGVDFPYLIYRMAVDGDVEPVRSFETGVVTRWLGGDLAALPGRLKRSPSAMATLRDFVRPGQPARMLDDFSLADPLPFAVWATDAAWRAFHHGAVAPHDSLDGIWE